ncbi:MAG: hypothetical protein LBJ94_02405 [Puniceicoccales bacterium]|jgi:hypothetical protein|nr:hypothetical protein [Puniceicoccales bacterium]
MNLLTVIPSTAARNSIATFNSTSKQQSVVAPSTPLLSSTPISISHSTLANSEAAFVDKPLVKRFVRTAADELPDLGLAGEGAEHRETLGKIAATLQRINQNLEKGFQLIGQNSDLAEWVHLDGELIELLSSDLRQLVDSLSVLNLDEQAEICTTQLSNNWTFPMLVGWYAPGHAGRLLDTIESLKNHNGGKTLAAILTAQSDGNLVSLTLVTRRAPEVAERLLAIISGLDKDVRMEICRAKFSDNWTLPMLVARYTPEYVGEILNIISDLGEDILAEIFTAQNDGSWSFPVFIARHAPKATGKFLEMIGSLKGRDGGKALVKILTMRSRNNWTFSMLMARYAPGYIEEFLNIIGDLDKDILAEIFTAQNDGHWSFPVFVVGHAPKAAGRLLGMIENFRNHDGGKTLANILTVRNNGDWLFLAFAIQHVPGVIGKLLDMVEGLDGRMRAEILMAQDSNKRTFPMFVACYAPRKVGKLLGMISGLDKKTQVEIFTAQDDTTKGTFPMDVVRYASRNTGRLLKMISGLSKDAHATILTAHNSSNVTLPMLAVQYAPKNIGKLLDMTKSLDEDAQVEVLTMQNDANCTFLMYAAWHGAPEVSERLLEMVDSLKGRDKEKSIGMILATSIFSIRVAEKASPKHINRLLDMIEGENFTRKRAVQRIIFSARDELNQSFIGTMEKRREALGADILARAHELADNCTLTGRFSRLPDEQKIAEEGLAATVEDFHIKTGILRSEMLKRETFEGKVAAAGMDALEGIEDWLLDFQPFPPIALLQEVTTALQGAISYTNACVDALRTGIEALETEIKLLRLKVSSNASPAERIVALEDGWLKGIRRSVLSDLDTMVRAKYVGQQRLNEAIEVELLFDNLHKKIVGQDDADMQFPNCAKIVLEAFVKLIGEVKQSSKGPGSNLFSSHGGSYTALRKHFLEGPNKKSYAAKLRRIEAFCPMEYPSPQGNNPNHKVSIGYDLIEPVAMLIFAAQERNPFIRDMLGEGTLRQLVDPKRIPVAALPKKVKLRDECIELKEGFTELMNYIESYAKSEHVMLAPESAEPELADFASPPETEEEKKARLLAELQSELRALREDPASINFGIVSEIYNTLDLDELFSADESLYLRFESFLSPDFEVALRAAAVQSEAEKYLDLAML